MNPPAHARPLEGLRVLVTRRPEQAEGLVRLLAEKGAVVVELASVEVAPPPDPVPLERALGTLAGYDWLVLTSANAVHAVSTALRRLGDSVPAGLRIAVVGPATATAVRQEFGRTPDLQPATEFRGEGLVEAFTAAGVGDRRFLIPSSDRARDLLPSALRGMGAAVDVVTAYRTVAPGDLRERVVAAVAAGIDVVTFASPSAVENLVAAAGDLFGSVPAAVIGPVTERAAREAGLNVAAVAKPSTAAGLADALAARFRRKAGSA